MRAILQVEHVSKSFGAIHALRDVSLSLRPHSIHALAGANAAGKSTLIRVVLGLDAPDSGTIRTRDERPLRIGYQPQTPALYEHLTVFEFLDLAALIGTVARQDAVADVLALFDLAPIGGQLIHTTSVGTRMKIAIAAALVQNPEVLVLDEPTNALDAVAVARLKERLRRLRDAGTTVLLATHMIDFAQGLCDDITVLRGGRVQYSGALDAFGDPGAPLESRVLPLIETP